MSLKKLIQWSRDEFSELPWRQNRTMYGTLVSEIMLQQTTVGTVKNHYERFLQRFPDLKSLASATEEELLVAWKGLGYYRRARNLKKISEHIFEHHKGKFPASVEELQKIAGIGPYTSHALMAIGRDERSLAVDANLERVIARLYGLKIEKGIKLQKHILQLFQMNSIFKNFNESWRDLNEALMDLGRTYCQARKATCDLCPLKKDCVAFSEKNPLGYPLEDQKKTTKTSVEHELHLLRLMIFKKNKILVYKKDSSEWLAGQYEIPTLILSTTDAELKQYPVIKKKFKFDGLENFKTGITKYKIVNYLYLSNEEELKALGWNLKVEWKNVEDESSNLSTATYKAIKKVVK